MLKPKIINPLRYIKQTYICSSSISELPNIKLSRSRFQNIFFSYSSISCFKQNNILRVRDDQVVEKAKSIIEDLDIKPKIQADFTKSNTKTIFRDIDGINWSISFKGIGSLPFSNDVQQILQSPINPIDICIKPGIQTLNVDGLIYLPEIKYRRILNKAFGPGGWGLVPRGPESINKKYISREYGLVCLNRLVSSARGEQAYFDIDEISVAAEGCKSNALVRCCKDLGVASELWDPIFIKDFKQEYCEYVWAENVLNKKKRLIWKSKTESLDYPYKMQQ